MPDYEKNNRAKRSFDDVYTQPTPHAYLQKMGSIGYQIGEQARSYCAALADLLHEANPGWPNQILDVGCSYGMGSAFVKYGCSFEELASFYRSRAPEDYESCATAMRAWLNVIRPKVDATVVGMDISENALKFAFDSGLIDCGITRNLEEEDLSADEQAWVESCNLLVCTGAIGYVGSPTFDRILAHLGKGRNDRSGPVAVMTVLRMFDPSDVRESFEKAGWAFQRVDNIRLPQRAFADADEQADVTDVIRRRGLDPEGWESLGVMYADLYVAAHPEFVDTATEKLLEVGRQRDHTQLFASHVAVATARGRDEALAIH